MAGPGGGSTRGEQAGSEWSDAPDDSSIPATAEDDKKESSRATMESLGWGGRESITRGSRGEEHLVSTREAKIKGAAME